MKKEKIPEGWERIKLKEVLQEVNERNKNEKVKRVLSVTNSKGFVNQKEYFEGTVHSENISNYKIVRKNQFAYNPSRVNVGSIDILEKYDEGVLSPMYVVFKIDETRLLPEYFKYYFETYSFFENVKNNTQGSVRNSLNFSALLDFQYLLPSIKEQEKIIDLLRKVENMILKMDEEINLLKVAKVTTMNNFLKKSFEWDKIYFNDAFEILQNNSFKRTELNYTNGMCKNIHYGDVLIKFNELLDFEKEKIPYVNDGVNIKKIRKDSYLQKGDIIIADTAEDETVGKVCEITNIKENAISGLHTIACRPKKEFFNGFLGFYMNSKEFHDQLIPLMQGIKVLGINKSNILKTQLVYPDIKTQEKCVNTMKAFNKNIELLVLKSEKYIHLKQALLQQLLTGKVRVKI